MKKIATFCMLLLATGCALLSPAELPQEPGVAVKVTQPPSAELAWDTDPETLVIQVFAGGSGSAPTAALVNELFAAQVWGNGRIIWTTWTDDFQRQVWQGQLSEAELAALLQTVADKGFLRMKARYAPRETVMDGSTTRISIHLLESSQEVSEYVSGAPDGFHELVELLTSGAGVAGTPYLPHSGQLTARELEAEAWLEQTALPLWDAAALGVDLQEAAGIWLEGDALTHAWEAVNRNPAFPIVAQDGRYFELHLRLPELSVMAPR